MLKECYIIDETLKDIDEEARTSFKEAFCGDNPKKSVNVTYEYPQTHSATDAMYVIQLGSGNETQDSIGGVEGSYDFRQDGVVREKVVLRQDDADPTRMVIPVSSPIGSVEGIPELSLSVSDDFKISDYEMSFKYDQLLDGMEVTVLYTSKQMDESPDLAGVIQGFTAKETVNIVPLSYNYDTVRCLDAILKAILITMRQSIPEKTMYQLQGISYGTMQNVLPNMDKPVFGRPYAIEYTVSYSLDNDHTRKVTEVIRRGGFAIGKGD